MQTILADRPSSAATQSAVLEVSGLSIDIGAWRAVHDVSLSLAAGRTLCVVGESGCGKSLTCLAIACLLPPTIRATGSVRLNGMALLGRRDAELTGVRGRQVAMITQDPMAALNPVMTVGRQIAEAMTLHGASHTTARAEARRLLDRVGIADAAARLNAYPHTLSGGMAQRVAIAIALACRPVLLIADEPTTALDVTIQAAILDLLRDAQRELGMALLLVTHDLGVVAEMADEVGVMYAGHLVELSPAAAFFARPAHPYADALLRCAPRLDALSVAAPIPGQVPRAGDHVDGCTFRPRCTRAAAACHVPQPMRAVGPGHLVACNNPVAA